MADLELHNPEFEITANIEGTDTTITVKPDETSDGVEYFICSAAGQKITQIRLDEDNQWEQMWGELSLEAVNAIGEAIKNKG